jgi:hypothetical protein
MTYQEPKPYFSESGGVLLEVILALVLFAAAASLIGSSLSSAMGNVERQRLTLHASNLAASVLAEIQMGIRPASASGPEAFEKPFEHWSWQLIPASIESEAGNSSGLVRMEVIIRHDDPVLVNRLTQMLRTVRSRNTTLPGGVAP